MDSEVSAVRWSCVHGMDSLSDRLSSRAPKTPGDIQTDCHTPNSTTEHFRDGFPFSGVTGVFPRALGWWRPWCPVGVWCPVLSNHDAQLLALRQVKHPTEGGSAKAKAADSACPVPPAQPGPAGSVSGVSQDQLTMVCAVTPAGAVLRACRSPLMGSPGSSPTP